MLFRAARLLKRSEGIEIAAVEPLSVDRELRGPVAEALGELPEASILESIVRTLVAGNA